MKLSPTPHVGENAMPRPDKAINAIACSTSLRDIHAEAAMAGHLLTSRRNALKRREAKRRGAIAEQ